MSKRDQNGTTERKVCLVWLRELLDVLDGDQQAFDDWERNRVPELKAEMRAAIELDKLDRPPERRYFTDQRPYERK